MTFEEFGALVAKGEREAEADLPRYVRRVWWLAVAGLVYLIAALAFMCVLLVLSLLLLKISLYLWVLVTSTVLYAMGGMLRAMFGRRGKYVPEHVLTRAEAPGLFKTLDALGGKVHQVELATDFTAAILYVPRLGILGWARHHLVLGMPLLLSLSEAEARSVIAHELGHITGQHLEKTRWLYTQRRIWGELSETRQEELAELLIKPFWAWIFPRFQAMSFVVSRHQEYEADAAAAAATTPADAGDALVRSYVDESWMHGYFWEGIHGLSASQDKPPRDAFTQMAAMFKEERDAARMTRLYEAVLARRTDLIDTHPCLRERLEAFGVDGAGGIAPTGRSAADAWFADLPATLKRLDQDAFKTLSPGWKQEGERRRRNAELEAGLDAGALPGEEEMAEHERSRVRAALTWKLKGSELGMAALREHVARWPEDQQGLLNLGHALLAVGEEEEGERVLRSALELDQRHGEEVLTALVDVRLERRDLAGADRVQDELSRWRVREEERVAEWREISAEVAYEPHGLPPERVLRLLEQLAQFSQVRELWLVRKANPPHFPEVPVYLIAFTTGKMALSSDDELVGKIVSAITMPSAFTVRDVTPRSARALRQRVDEVEDSKQF
jgi:hypothetical protein